MSILSQETQNVQNPALGAMLLWRFATGYEQGSNTHNPTPIPLLFIVLPIILHEETASFIKSTRQPSGLRGFASKFSASSNAKNDLILSIQGRALRMRKLSTDSLRQAIASKLISTVTAKGMAIPLTLISPRSEIPKAVEELCKQAEKLGVWCSQVSLYEISVILKIGF